MDIAYVFFFFFFFLFTIFPSKRSKCTAYVQQCGVQIDFWATVAKLTTERHPFLGIRFLISSNRRPLLENGTVNTFPRKLYEKLG
jgi:hypothetical protein